MARRAASMKAKKAKTAPKRDAVEMAGDLDRIKSVLAEAHSYIEQQDADEGQQAEAPRVYPTDPPLDKSDMPPYDPRASRKEEVSDSDGDSALGHAGPDDAEAQEIGQDDSSEPGTEGDLEPVSGSESTPESDSGTFSGHESDTQIESEGQSVQEGVSEPVADTDLDPEPAHIELDEGEDFSNLPPVLIVAAEAAPLAKTGGLADVVGALPKYLKKLGVDARIIMPFHRQMKDRYASEAQHLFSYFAGEQWTDQFVGIDKLELDGVTYYFVDSEYYFGGPIYRGGNFEGEQYTFFMQAVCDAIPNLDFDPGIVHCNDWHTSLIPFKLKAKARNLGYQPRKFLLTIHNLAFQGTFGDDTNVRVIGDAERAYAWDLGCWNMLKAGIDTADRVNTVSPTYAWEITTPQYGEGLEGDLGYLAGEGRLSGILNGIDTDEWNPATDKAIPFNFSVSDRAGKLECKKALMEELGLDFDEDAPLISMVGRLTPQKGVNIACDIIEDLIGQGVRFCVLGSGDHDLENRLRCMEGNHKGRLCSYIGYNGQLSHKIYAASDFFLMPSAFEPCGISQMIAMRYGALPIVHETGGLRDTVTPYNQFTGEGCGFSYSRQDFWDAVEACKRALTAWSDKDIMSRLIENAMNMDFGFDRCARSYAQLYESMM